MLPIRSTKFAYPPTGPRKKRSYVTIDVIFASRWENGGVMFSIFSAQTASAAAVDTSTDPVAFVIVGVIVLVLFLGIVIRVLRRNRLKK